MGTIIILALTLLEKTCVLDQPAFSDSPPVRRSALKPRKKATIGSMRLNLH